MTTFIPRDDEVLAAADKIIELYVQAEKALVERVLSRVRAVAPSTSAWDTQQLIDLNRLRNDVEGRVERMLRGDARLPELLEDAYKAGWVSAGAALSPVATDVFAGTPNNVRAIANELSGALGRNRFQLFRNAADIYRVAVSEVVSTTVTGGATDREAAQQAADRLRKQGIRLFTDSRGRRWRIESYARMAVRTATARAHLAGAVDRWTTGGVTLVQVTTAARPCRTCSPWEGRTLAISGQTQGYKTLEEAQAAGLFHPNCRHGLRPVIPVPAVMAA